MGCVCIPMHVNRHSVFLKAFDDKNVFIPTSNNSYNTKMWINIDIHIKRNSFSQILTKMHVIIRISAIAT